MDSYSQEFTIPMFGTYTLQYGKTWPELTEALRKLYRDKVGVMPWLPPSWFASVNALHGGPNGEIMVIAPSGATYAGGKGVPFLDTPEKKAWWDTLAKQVAEIITKYAENKAVEGRAELEKAYAAAAFWNVGAGQKLIQWAQVAASPITTLTAAAKNPYKTVAIVGAGAVVVLAFLWWWKNPRPSRR